MPGTRVDVIEKISKWAKEETGAPAEPICWVNAAAGFVKGYDGTNEVFGGIQEHKKPSNVSGSCEDPG